MKKATIILESVKDSDGYFELCAKLGHMPDVEDDYGEIVTDYRKVYKMFKYGEYGTFELEIDENFNIIGGRVIPTG